MLADIIATPSVGFQGGVRGGIRHQEHLNLNILPKFYKNFKGSHLIAVREGSRK